MFSSGLYGYPGDYLFWCVLFLSIVIHTWCFFRFFPKHRRPRLRLLVGNVLVFFCLIGSAALIGESYFRFICVETDSFGVSLPAQKWFALYVKLNSLGCRDKEWTREKPAGVYRIAFVGDSFTYGWGVKHVEDRFTNLIQASFDARAAWPTARPNRGDNGDIEESYRDQETMTSGVSANNPSPTNGPVGASDNATIEPAAAHHEGTSRLLRAAEASRTPTEGEHTLRHVEVMNVAKPGWGTGDQLQPVKDMIDVYGVDEIVLCYLPNDIEKLIPRSPGFDPIRPPEMTLLNPTTSALLDYLFHRIVVPRRATVSGYYDWLASGFATESVWRRHQQQLYALAALCRERRVRFRVVLLPFPRSGGRKYQADRVHAMLRAFFQTNGIDVLDLLPVIADRDPAELVVNDRDAHPNETAHAAFARAILRRFYNTKSPPQP